MKGQFKHKAARRVREIAAKIGMVSLSLAMLLVLHMSVASAEGLENEQAETQTRETEYALTENGDAGIGNEAPANEDGLEAQMTDDMARETEEALTNENGEAVPQVLGSELFIYEKIARVEGTNCTVLIRYDSESGIPAEAELTACRIDGTDSTMEADYDLCMMSISLIADGIDYANTYRYEVQVLMDQPVYAKDGDVRAMRYDGNTSTMLDATADMMAAESVGSVSFLANA